MTSFSPEPTASEGRESIYHCYSKLLCKKETNQTTRRSSERRELAKYCGYSFQSKIPWSKNNTGLALLLGCSPKVDDCICMSNVVMFAIEFIGMPLDSIEYVGVRWSCLMLTPIRWDEVIMLRCCRVEVWTSRLRQLFFVFFGGARGAAGAEAPYRRNAHRHRINRHLA